MCISIVRFGSDKAGSLKQRISFKSFSSIVNPLAISSMHSLTAASLNVSPFSTPPPTRVYFPFYALLCDMLTNTFPSLINTVDTTYIKSSINTPFYL